MHFPTERVTVVMDYLYVTMAGVWFDHRYYYVTPKRVNPVFLVILNAFVSVFYVNVISNSVSGVETKPSLLWF